MNGLIDETFVHESETFFYRVQDLICDAVSCFMNKFKMMMVVMVTCNLGRETKKKTLSTSLSLLRKYIGRLG